MCVCVRVCVSVGGPLDRWLQSWHIRVRPPVLSLSVDNAELFPADETHAKGYLLIVELNLPAFEDQSPSFLQGKQGRGATLCCLEEGEKSSRCGLIELNGGQQEKINVNMIHYDF